MSKTRIIGQIRYEIVMFSKLIVCISPYNRIKNEVVCLTFLGLTFNRS